MDSKVSLDLRVLFCERSYIKFRLSPQFEIMSVRVSFLVLIVDLILSEIVEFSITPPLKNLQKNSVKSIDYRKFLYYNITKLNTKLIITQKGEKRNE